MEFSGHSELVLLALLAAVTALVALAPMLRVPYPILLVAGGLALGFIPGVPELTLPPQLVLVGILPPLLYTGGFFTGLRELRRNVGEITLLSEGLVAATMVVVAVVAHSVVAGLSWPSAFVLGAVVSPTDPLSAISIARRLGVPRRIVAVVEGESLLNDAAALVLYRAAVVAVISGAFSFWDASLRFVLSVSGGIAVGLAVGWIVALVRRRLDNIPAEIAVSLLTGYLAYIPAQALHVSGCSPPSPSASTSAGAARSCPPPRCGCRDSRSGRPSSSSSTRCCSRSSGCSFDRSSTPSARAPRPTSWATRFSWSRR